jgi:hypothetical protein
MQLHSNTSKFSAVANFGARQRNFGADDATLVHDRANFVHDIEILVPGDTFGA